MENEVNPKEEKILTEKSGGLEKPENTQVYNIIISKDPSWQNIIYELISTERLDPWNIDISRLCLSYFEKIRELETTNFHISSKMLLVAALLLRIKSEILLNRYIKEIDQVLFGKEEEIKKLIERIEIDESEIPILSPKTPMPRFKKVTLQELINALDVAIKTETRRINKEIEVKQAKRLSYVDIPKFKRINIKDRIRHFYARVLSSFKTKKAELKLPYTHFTGNSKEEKITCFLPMLYLSNHGKLWLEQEKHYEEIYIYLYDAFKKNFPDFDKELVDLSEGKSEFTEDIKAEMIEEIGKEIEEIAEELSETEKQKRVEKLNKDFENPIGDLLE
mgnify:CR=1 FL=1